MTSGMFLTEAEIDELCQPLKMPSAQVRFLRASGLTVTVKPNGRAAVLRSHAEVVLAGKAKADADAIATGAPPPFGPRPNVDGFLQLVKGRNGKKKSLEPA